MRRGLFALVALALVAAVPARAQQAPSTPDDDLRCAAWAAILGGLNQDQPEAASAFGMALAWFLGRYEAAAGQPFERALTQEYIEALVPQMETIELACRPRMQEMGTRLATWGTALQAAGR